MGIYIKNMKMPQSCAECDIKIRCFTNAKNIEWLTYHPAFYEERLTNCPLVQVPPHGRLIDADDLLTDKSVSIIGKGMIFGGQYVFSESEIVNAPTIIPAEEGET